MRTFSISCLAALTIAGCSWQNTVDTASRAPQHLRFSERIWTDNAMRWRLPAATTIVAVDEGLAPQSWILAANAGLNSVFDEHGTQQEYRLLVRWPTPVSADDDDAHKSVAAKFKDFITLPRTATSQVLTVKLFDQAEHFVTTIDLHISPALLGPDWNDEQMIQASFRHLARSLRDG